MARVLTRLGFVVVRQSGSHRIYRNDEGKRVTLPFHRRGALHPKVVTSIVRDAGITADQLRDML
jgi:predicted RNA binding protein YcfA (HicA-like mRNA interferase family)